MGEMKNSKCRSRGLKEVVNLGDSGKNGNIILKYFLEK
jgi:hypothetical protein